MSATLALVACGGVLFAAGTALLLARPLTRILLGAVLIGNGVNLLVLATSGPAGQAALLHPGSDPKDMADPLPQAFILTAIVITLAVTAFLVTMAYRSWQHSGNDDVPDDMEDIRVVRRATYAEERERLRAAYRRHRLEYRAPGPRPGGAGGPRTQRLPADGHRTRPVQGDAPAGPGRRAGLPRPAGPGRGDRRGDPGGGRPVADHSGCRPVTGAARPVAGAER
ncbi:Na(+)/H(+) antiporter subunit C [Streptomyces albus]